MYAYLQKFEFQVDILLLSSFFFLISMKEEEEDEDETQRIHKRSPRVMSEEPSVNAPSASVRPGDTENTKPPEQPPSDKSPQGVVSPRPKMELKLTSPTCTDASPAAGAATEPPTPQTPAEIREKIMYNKDGMPITRMFFETIPCLRNGIECDFFVQTKLD